MMDEKIVPFLKWPGGKRWFVSKHQRYFPKSYNRYFEPFLGSGSVYFHLRPNEAYLGDLNEELVVTYNAIKENWEEIYTRLSEHHKNHSKDYYYEIRDFEPQNPIERAARMIYLNRTCFNGIYRVNLKGKFNVPIGTKTNVICPTDDFEKTSELLSKAEIFTTDFEDLISASRECDFVFADPPYTVRHNNNGFIKYNETLFSWDDQIRLANALAEAKDRGVKILSTNANHKLVRQLYKERGFKTRAVSRYSSISASSNSRNQYKELVIWANTK